MVTSEREAAERKIRELCTGGEVGKAAEQVITLYGAEIQRLLKSMLRDEELAREAYCIFSEALLRDLPRFRWEASVRTWSYRVAKHVAFHLRRSTSREELVTGSLFQELDQRERSETHPWLRTDVKRRFRSLRERLDPEERRILELRLDQKQPWNEVVRALAGPDASLCAKELKRRSDVVRQQYQRIKARLRLLAREDSGFSRDLQRVS